jgi:hypothetical protein
LVPVSVTRARKQDENDHGSMPTTIPRFAARVGDEDNGNILWTGTSRLRSGTRY